MGLFDLFKKDRGYEIHSLEFCEVGKDGKRDTRPSSKHYTDSRYIMPVVKMTSRIDRTVKIKVRITEPSGKTHTYDFGAIPVVGVGKARPFHCGRYMAVRYS